MVNMKVAEDNKKLELETEEWKLNIKVKEM